MCKKGITLIECVVYLALISIASMIFLGGIASYKNKSDDIKKTSEIREVKKAFMEASFRCLQENLMIYVELTEDRIFIGNDKTIKLRELKINVKDLKTKSFYIDNRGLIKENLKIEFIGEGEEFVIESCSRCKKVHL